MGYGGNVKNLGNFQTFLSFLRLLIVGENNNKHRELLATALALFKRVGIKSVSMDDIAREAGISKKTLYQMVSTKEELIEQVMQNDFECDMQLFRQNNEQARDAIDEFLRNSRHFIREMRSISPATMRDLQKYYPALWKGMVQAHHAEFGRNLAENIERGMDEGLYRANLDPLVISSLYSGMVAMMMDRQVFPNHERPLSDIMRQMTEYHFNGIVNQFGRERIEDYLKAESLD